MRRPSYQRREPSISRPMRTMRCPSDIRHLVRREEVQILRSAELRMVQLGSVRRAKHEIAIHTLEWEWDDRPVRANAGAQRYRLIIPIHVGAVAAQQAENSDTPG